MQADDKNKGNNDRSLAKNSVKLGEVIGQGVAGAAPAAASLVTLTGAAAYAYASLPLAVIIATIAVLLDANRLALTSKYIQSAGGIYSFIAGGLGRLVAFLVGWGYVLYTLSALSFLSLNSLFIIAAFQTIGISLPDWSWIPLAIIFITISAVISYSGIRPSLRFTLTMSTLEIIFVLATALLILSKVPPDIQTFTPSYAPDLFSLGVGTAFVFLAFAGYETTSVLGEEAVDPKSTISKGVFLSSVLVAIVYIIAMEAFVVGWGVYNMDTYFQELVPGIILADRYGGVILAAILTLLLINSVFACSTTFYNTASRVIYAMARDGILPSWLYSVNPKRKTPDRAILFSFIFSLVYTLLFSFILGPENLFLAVGVLSTFGFLVAIFTANLSLIFILKRRRELNIYNILLILIVGIIIAFVIFANIISTSVNLPVEVGVFTFAAWIIFGGIYYYLFRK
ncbi:MAG: APC family permease [Sulfolobaceae archaeon]